MGVNTTDLKNQMKKSQAAGAPANKQAAPGNSIAAYLKKMAPAIANVLPKHMTPERMARIALSEIRKNPQLANCNVESLGAAIMQAATLGLEPTQLGHCYFVPFNRKDQNSGKWVKDVQFIIGYKGYIDLANRTGQLLSIRAEAVHKNDHFICKYGIHEELEHIEADTDRGEVIKYYAYAKLKGGGYTFVCKSKEWILEHAFKHSKQVKEGRLTGPWKNHFDSMAKKTLIRELIKYMPMSIEYQEQFTADEQVIKKVNEDKDDENVFDMEFTPIEDQEQEPETEQQQPQEPEPLPKKKQEPLLDAEDFSDIQEELEAARKAQAELDKKKTK